MASPSIEALLRIGLRSSGYKADIAGVLAENDGASCKDICCIVHNKDKSIGTATVYRMIKALEDIGVVERIDMIKLQ